jgi:enoyl-CoA hydratase
MVINIDDNVLIDKQGHLGWLTLLKQTLTPEFRFAFFKAMTQLENDKDIRVIILKSAAENIFFAGADIKGMNGDGSEPEGDVLAQIRAGMADSYRVMERLEYSSKPSIAAIDGAAVGGGCELTVACDITIASERANLVCRR